MTRDEAIKIVEDQSGSKNFIEALVDALSGLGIIKLDEQKSANQRFDEALSGIVALEWRDRYWKIIHDAGLKIVEK